MPKEDKPEQPGLEIVIAGKKTTFRLADMTGRDAKDFRGEVGFAPILPFRDQALMDIDVIAAYVWIARRKLKPTLQYDEVLDSITYDNVEVTQTGSVEDEDDDPEA